MDKPTNDARIEALEREQSTPSVYERIRILETAAAVTGQRVNDHDAVIVELKDHLGKVVEQFTKLDRKLLVVTVVMGLSSPFGQKLLALLGIG